MKNIFSVCYLNKKQRHVSGLLLLLFSFQNVSFAATGIYAFNRGGKLSLGTKNAIATTFNEPTKSESRIFASNTIQHPKKKTSSLKDAKSAFPLKYKNPIEPINDPVEEKQSPKTKELSLGPIKENKQVVPDPTPSDSASSKQEELIYQASGPQTPELSSFESVNTTTMVDPYTGDLSYSLPVMEVPGAHDGGYSVALAYQSGAGPNDEASWVGHGWNLNPGVINRIKKGFPDDIQGSNVEYINNSRPNVTVTVAPAIGIEAFSINLNASKFFRYNNYKGFGGGYSAGLSILDGGLGCTWVMEDGKGSFSPYCNPFTLLSKAMKASKSKSAAKEVRTNHSNVATSTIRNIGNRVLSQVSSSATNYGISLFADQGGALNVTEYTGSNETVELGVVGDIPTITIGISGNIRGTLIKQTPKASTTRKAYGYLYSDRTYQSLTCGETYTNDIMDYHLEKNGQFSKRDNFLPVPYNDVDIYNVSAEGLTGAFRAFWSKPTMVFPPSSASNTDMTSVHVQGHIGTTIGLGGSVDIGYSWQKSSPNWDGNGNTNSFITTSQSIPVGASGTIVEDEPFNFKFLSDLGGSTILDNNFTSLPVSTTPSIGSGSGSSYHAKNFNTIDNSGRIGRTSFVDYHTNEYLVQNATSPSPKRTFEGAYSGPTNQYLNFIDRSSSDIAKHIGEFSVTSPNGENFVYALPVYNRNEQSMSYNIRTSDIIPEPSMSPYQYEVKADISGTRNSVGEKHNYAYPAYYLLTSIRSGDYADVNNNYVLDENDLGGYTKFTYERAFGSAFKSGGGSWYSWRMPYTGVTLEQNHLDNENDNMGNFSCGEKEVYYTRTVETKTHIAVFVTNKSTAFVYNGVTLPNTAGSGKTRLDGMSANPNNENAAKGVAWVSTNVPQFLEKIILFAKPIQGGGAPVASDFKTIKTVRFDYNYSIWPNSPGVNQIPNPNQGKLTLKKIWVENENVKMAKVSPYQFDYIYPSTALTDYPTKYAGIADYYTPKAQTPDYKAVHAECVDRWGNYFDNGQLNRSQLRPYTANQNSSTFDPSAWHLKNIQVPSGAQIHIQYEQDDYTKVQDKPANVMLPLISPTNDNSSKYEIDMGSMLTAAQCTTYQNYLINYFSENNNPYIYFKFLYKLGDPGATPPSNLPLATNDCSTEYIDGYVHVEKIEVSGTILTFTLGDGGTPPANPWLSFPTNNYKYPKNICIDYVKTETGLQVGGCNPMAMNNGAEALARKLLNRFVNQINSFLGNSTVCASMVPQLSYLKLPVDPNNMVKKGGGLRVKRLLRFDKGLQSSGNDKALYGVEYTYKGPVGLSSGVATNEPADGREENVLIEFIEKKQKQKWLQKAMGGVDLEQFEGPYGESALPAPAVGYSFVQLKNIHTGKTDDGISTFEYFTAADFPYDSYFDGANRFFGHSEMAKSDYHHFKLGLFKHTITNELKAAQSYHQIIYNIGGRPKSEAKYLGSNLNNVVYKKEYVYYAPGEKIPLQTEVVSNVIENNYLGVDMEIVAERKRSIEKYKSTAVNGDLAFSLTLPISWPSGGALIWTSIKETEMSSLVTNKTTYLPVVLKSVTETKSGIKHLSENITYNKYSGNAVVVKTQDEFSGVTTPASIPGNFYSYTQPALLHYSNFNQIAYNQSKVYPIGGTVTSAGGPPVLTLTLSSPVSTLVKGDLLQLRNAGSGFNYTIVDQYFIKQVTNAMTYIVERYNSGPVSYPQSFNFFRVEQSGRNNTTDQVVGNMVTYGKIPTNLSPSTAALNAFNTSGFSSVSGVAINLGQWGMTGDLGNIQDCRSLSCPNSQMVYESFIPTGSNNLYVVKYNPDNCYQSGSFENIGGTPLTANPNYTSTPVPAGTPLPHFVLGYELLGPKGGVFTYVYNVAACAWELKYTYANPVAPNAFITKTVYEKLCNCNNVIPNVITLNAVNFADTWDYSQLKEYSTLPAPALANNFSNNKTGDWRIYETRGYNKNRNIDYTSPSARNYNSGMFEYAYVDWKSFSDPNWVLSSTARNYSPHGEAMEETDAIGIYSSMQYSVSKTLPSLVINNAQHNSAFFESFEDFRDLSSIQAKYGGTFTFQPNYNSNITYTTTGRNCIGLGANGTMDIPFVYTNDYDAAHGGEVILKFWASSWPTFDEVANATLPVNPGATVELLTNNLVTSSATTTRLATVGPWNLFQVKFSTSALTGGANVYKFRIKCNLTSSLTLDDIRYQPIRSAMKTYVYDAAKKRLLAEFGDDHMPTKFVYNLDGKLVRKMVYTEKGQMTILEGQYNNGFKDDRTQ